MKAVILPSADTESLAPLTTWVPEFLVPIANKPIVEHLVELLARHGIRDIIMVLKHMPYETEEYFGDGSRWGVRFSYSLQGSYEGPADSLRRIETMLGEVFMCLPADMVTDLDISNFVDAHCRNFGDVTIAETAAEGGPPAVRAVEGEDLERMGTLPFILNRNALSLLARDGYSTDFAHVFNPLINEDVSVNVYHALFSLLRIRNPADYVHVQAKALNGGFNGMLIPGRALQRGVLVGRRSRVHPGASFDPPVLIGSHCRVGAGSVLGPGTVISDHVILDENVSIHRSVVLGHTFVGSNIEIRDSIVMGNWVFRVPDSLSVYLGDELILGDLSKRSLAKKGEFLFNRILASLFFLISLPVLVILCLYHFAFPSRKFLVSERRYGRHKREDLSGVARPQPFRFFFFRSRSRLIRKLPGLINVIRGDLHLVGVSPLTEEEYHDLPDIWRTARIGAPAGLFHLWEAEGGRDPEWEERMISENYYAATHTFRGDLKILLKSLLRFL